MGWGTRVAMRHAQRLEAYGWVGDAATTARGDGSLLVVTRAGVQMTGLEVRPAQAPGADMVGTLAGVRVDRGVA